MFWVKFPRITLCREIPSRMIDTSNTKQLAQKQINISRNTAKYFTPPQACFEIKQLRSLLYGGFCFLCTPRHTRYICYSTTLESAVNHLERDGCKGFGTLNIKTDNFQNEYISTIQLPDWIYGQSDTEKAGQLLSSLVRILQWNFTWSLPCSRWSQKQSTKLKNKNQVLRPFSSAH